jgi:hypothetical protein
LPIAAYWAKRGAVKMPQASVPQMPAMPCAESTPTGSSSLRSISMMLGTTISPPTRPMIGAAQFST